MIAKRKKNEDRVLKHGPYIVIAQEPIQNFFSYHFHNEGKIQKLVQLNYDFFLLNFAFRKNQIY